MYSIRTNGDSIAQEFAKLLGSNLNIEKTAQEIEQANPVSDNLNTVGDDGQTHDDTSDYLSDEALSGLLVAPADDASDSATDSVDDAIDNLDDGMRAFSSNITDPAGHYIMNGLGKIAGSLRGKGEAFAADVVEATALSIRGDLAKEANRKSGIISTLNKMASDFTSNGDSFAADMVKVTINKISR